MGGRRKFQVGSAASIFLRAWPVSPVSSAQARHPDIRQPFERACGFERCGSVAAKHETAFT
jgi:hypothetical protein